MSTTPAASISSQPVVVPVRDLQNSTGEAIAKRNAEQTSKLAATAVVAESAKDSRKGLVVDIKV
jgi:hypothetical protein